MASTNTLVTFITQIQDLAQEKGLATTTVAEIATLMNLAVHQIRIDHDWNETIVSSNLSFVASSTVPYATVAAPADYWVPIRLNNADDEYKFWYMEPNALRDLRRGDRYTHDDVEQAFAKDGSNILIYHNKTETLPLYYYSKYLVLTVTTAVPKDIFDITGVAADTFLLNNDEILIQRTLMYLYQKEPDSKAAYEEAKLAYLSALQTEKLLNPSQRLTRGEELQFIG